MILKIGGHKVKVRYSKDIEETGESSVFKNEIVINSEAPQSQQGVTLVHEILHFTNCVLDHTLQESLSEQIYQVIHDNPQLMKALCPIKTPSPRTLTRKRK